MFGLFGGGKKDEEPPNGSQAEQEASSGSPSQAGRNTLAPVNTKPEKELGKEVNKLDEVIERDVRPWLDLVDTLRAQGIQEEVPLPQIAVMGDQSCGKSSVLEALSGVQFPRGSGLVTRCPVQLTMKRGGPGAAWSGRASVMWRRGAQPAVAGAVQSPDQLRAVIEELMNLVCTDTANGFSTDSIVVEITAPDCPDLTLIDLPGIVRTAVSGQSRGVITEVNGLIESYLNQERTIILAIVPANQDVATVDILERAKAVDPAGMRTIGVLTKPDLIGPGNEEEVLQVLANQRKPLKLGYVMVKNRNQQQLSKGMSLHEAHVEEMAFFAKHGVFSRVEPGMLGVEALTKRLVRLLVERIKAALPNMKWEMQENLNEVEKELRPLNRNVPRSFGERLKSLMQIVTEFTRLLRASIKGEYRDPVLNSNPDLRIRSMVDQKFRELQHGVASLNPGFEHPDFPKVLQEELRAHRGRELCGIVNSQFFYIFMLQQVEKFRPQVEMCRNAVCNIVMNVAMRLICQVAPQYPGLVESFQDIIQGMVDERGEGMQPELDQLFDKEKNPFTENQDLLEAINQVRFERFDRVLYQVMMEAGDSPADGGSAEDVTPLKEWVGSSLGQWYRYSHGANPTSKVEDMSTILQAYWRVSSKRVCDNVCMLLETSFLGEVPNDLEAQLLTLAQRMPDDGVSSLFKEDAALVNRRDFLEQRRVRLQRALAKIDEIAPDVVAISRRQDRMASPERDWRDAAASGAAAAPPGALGAGAGAGAAAAADGAYGGGGGGAAALRRPAWASGGGGGAFGQQRGSIGGGASGFGLEADVVYNRSEPERRAEAARDSSAAHFYYTKDGDNGGLIYWLGTHHHTRKFENPHDAGLVRVTSSGMEVGTEAAVVSRRRAPSRTKRSPESWICVDVGSQQSLDVSHYSLCSGADREGFDMVNWVCEGYDVRTRMWVILTHDTTRTPLVLRSPYGVATWPVDSMGKSFRFIRLRSTGPNGAAGQALPVCAIELYGRLFRQPEL